MNRKLRILRLRILKGISNIYFIKDYLVPLDWTIIRNDELILVYLFISFQGSIVNKELL